MRLRAERLTVTYEHADLALFLERAAGNHTDTVTESSTRVRD